MTKIPLNEKSTGRMADFLPQIVFECDLTGHLTYVNKGAFEIFKFTEEDLKKGLNVFSVICPEDRQRAAENMQELLTGKQFRGNEYSALKKDGVVFPIMIYSSVIEEKGSPAGLRGIIIDMTDIRRADEERIFTESKFRAIYDQTSNAVGILNTEGILLEANRAAKKALGRNTSAFIGKPFWLTPWWEHSPDTRTLLESKIRKALQGEYIRFETTYLDHQKKPRSIDLSIKPVLDQNRKVFCLILEGSDITDRKKTEEALRQSEETFRALAENSADVIMRFDHDCRHLYVNPAVKTISGMAPALFIGKTHEELEFPDHLCRLWQAAVAQVFISRKRHRIEFQLPNGIWIDWLLMPEFGINNDVKAVITSGRDITDQKQADHIMRLVEYGVNHSRDSIFWLDSETRIIYVNEAACRSLGYSCQELLSMKISDIDPDFPLKAWGPHLAKLREYGSVTHESRHHAKDGRIFPVEITGNYVVFEGKEGSFAFARDISDRKQAEAEHQRLQEQLTQAQKMDSIGRLAGGVAHDFNNMLSAIIGYVALGRNHPETSPKLHGYLKQIQAAADRSADLTRQLLAFARKQAITPKILDLNHTIDGMLKMIRRIIGEDIELVWRPGKALWRVNLDPSQVDQVLINLCANARDAIEGNGRIFIRTENVLFSEAGSNEIPESRPGRYVMLEVQDTGCGMDTEIISCLFEPFFTTKETGKGTGLGLATVYGIVKQNNGFIHVQSRPGYGTTFKIYLPWYEEEDERQPLPPPLESTVEKGHETILLVEDELMILEMTTEMLELQGYKILAADRPEKAIRIAREHADKIHLLVTDVVMPEMNGWDLASKLLALRPDLKCLFMSGYTADVITQQGFLNKDMSFIQKPFSMSDLTGKIREVLL